MKDKDVRSGGGHGGTREDPGIWPWPGPVLAAFSNRTIIAMMAGRVSSRAPPSARSRGYRLSTCRQAQPPALPAARWTPRKTSADDIAQRGPADLSRVFVLVRFVGVHAMHERSRSTRRFFEVSSRVPSLTPFPRRRLVERGRAGQGPRQRGWGGKLRRNEPPAAGWLQADQGPLPSVEQWRRRRDAGAKRHRPLRAAVSLATARLSAACPQVGTPST